MCACVCVPVCVCVCVCVCMLQGSEGAEEVLKLLRDELRVAMVLSGQLSSDMNQIMRVLA